MKFTKKSISQWVGTCCERQLGLSLYTDQELKNDIAASSPLGLPTRQIRPGLEQMAQAGDEWQEAKTADLIVAFGAAAVHGNQNGVPETNAAGLPTAVKYDTCDLGAILSLGKAGDFIVEAEFALSPLFTRTWRLDQWAPAANLDFASVRPDILEVADASRCPRVLSHVGDTKSDSDDTRLRLRVIDAKLNANPGPGYFAELAYYSLALAAWLVDNGYDSTHAVAADPAVWAGSHGTSVVREAFNGGITGSALYSALDDDLEHAPVEVFVSAVSGLLIEVLPRIAQTVATVRWQTDLDWHVQSSCSGCDYLGQSFPGASPTPGSPSAPHASHCVPEATSIEHLSRLAFVSRGGTRALREAGKTTVRDVATTTSTDTCYDEHHSLRAGRQILPDRASALIGNGHVGLSAGQASTTAIPKGSDLSLYITADFDQSSAITIAFGITGVFFPSRFGAGVGSPHQQIPASVYWVQQRDVESERGQLEQLLSRIDQAMNQALQVDGEATMQVYVWDRLTYDHLVRVVGRHLGWLLATNRLHQLAWLFPPDDQIVANERITKTPIVSIVNEAVRGLLATSQPHTYTLLGTARIYHTSSFDDRYINTPAYWTTEFSDQIPSERAFDLWTGSNRRIPYADQVANLNRTVKAKLRALDEVTRRLREDLRGQLTRKTPEIRHLSPPSIVPASSLLGSVLYAHSRLSAAVNAEKKAQTRALSDHEREARFAAIIGTRAIVGAERATLLSRLGIDSAADEILAYETSPLSAESKIEEGEFLAAASPRSAQGLLDQPLYPVLSRSGLQAAAWKPPWARTFSDLLGVNILHFDRRTSRVVIRVNNQAAVAALANAGIVDLSVEIVIDQISADFLSPKIRAAVRGIGNPPKANAQAQIMRHALGVTSRGPNVQRQQCPTEDLIWDPLPLEAFVVHRPANRLKTDLRASTLARGDHDLNEPQWEAFDHAMTRRLTLIWGPPGTGKSQTVGQILDGYMLDASQRKTGENLLLTAFTWTAIDNVVEKVASRHVVSKFDIFRVRSGRGTPPPSWAIGVDLDLDLPADVAQLVGALSGSQPVLIASTCQQTQKIVEAYTAQISQRSAAGEVFDMIVIDEAGQLDVGHAILAFAGARSTAQVVVAGDPLQLPPIHHVSPPETLDHHVGPIYKYFRDHFGVPECTLTINYRSNEEIVRLARYAGYPIGYESNQPALRLSGQSLSRSAPVNWPSTLDWDPIYMRICDPDFPVVCITYPEGIAGQWNQFEATLVEGIVAIIENHLSGDPCNSDPNWVWEHGVGIVTPHRAQRALISTQLQASRQQALHKSVNAAVDTVERFQGRERVAVVASYAVGDPDAIANEAEFIQNLNRFNVLATRAQAKLVVILSDEVVNHIAGDLEIVRSSKLLKAFANTYCDQREPFGAIHRTPNGRTHRVEAILRYPTSVSVV